MESTYDEAYEVGLDSFLTDICGVFSSMRANEKIKDVCGGFLFLSGNGADVHFEDYLFTVLCFSPVFQDFMLS